MTADERLALIWQKVERANKHKGELKAAIDAFTPVLIANQIRAY